MNSGTINRRVIKDISDAQTNLKREFGIYIAPEESNYYHVHFVFPGPPDTPYFGGLYHGLLKLNANHPMGPPNVHMITPSGRFTPESYPCAGRGICTSFTSYHPDTWSPLITIETILKGLISFMCDNKDSGIGSIQGVPDAQRKKLATESLKAIATDPMVITLMPELIVELQTGAYVPHKYESPKPIVIETKPMTIKTFDTKRAASISESGSDTDTDSDTETKRAVTKKPVKKSTKKVPKKKVPKSESESESEPDDKPKKKPVKKPVRPAKKVLKKRVVESESESTSESASESASESSSESSSSESAKKRKPSRALPKPSRALPKPKKAVAKSRK